MKQFESSLELVMVDDYGVLQSIFDQPIFGTIKDIAILPCNKRFRRAIPQLQGKDLLLVTSDHFRFRTSFISLIPQ
ncbi:hypothetical protein L1987_27955 [Smallanthus sonchifolius]|uniref:Uncharacterized protein n=1 Tax=Smallanthus sonchifolius TaxID=185202 RepID=A0ACB9IEJ3_9ASTR|nr:hypothetical protein L1987_27955 [Smallanthus sonchifolius]